MIWLGVVTAVGTPSSEEERLRSEHERRGYAVSMIGKRSRAFVQSWVAEVVGTFFLLSAILAAPPSFTFAAAGAILLVMVVSLGKVSGAQLNPAVTTALIVARRFPLKDGLAYLPAQLLGALLAILSFDGLLGRTMGNVDPGNQSFFAEFVGTFLLTFVVTQVTVHEVPEAGSALGVGLALAMGVLIAGPSSGGVLNPAIGLALLLTGHVTGVFSALLPYLLAPIVAGVLAGLLGAYLTPVRVPKGDPRRQSSL